MDVKTFFKSKWFAFGLVAVIATVAITSMVFMFSDDGSMKVKKVGGNDLTYKKASDYSRSRLELYDHGTFTIRIVGKKTPEWVGIGTYEKKSKSYVFTYTDIYGIYGPDKVYQRHTWALAEQENNPKHYTYPVRNGLIVVHLFNNNVFHFG